MKKIEIKLLENDKLIESKIVFKEKGFDITTNDNRILKKLFGIFLLIIAILETYSFFRQYIIQKKEDNKNK